MCELCATAIELLPEDAELRDYVLWNETCFPFGTGEETARQIELAAWLYWMDTLEHGAEVAP